MDRAKAKLAILIGKIRNWKKRKSQLKILHIKKQETIRVDELIPYVDSLLEEESHHHHEHEGE